MKIPFQWCALKPPSRYPISIASVANWSAIFGMLLSLSMLALDLDQSRWLYLPLFLSAFLFGLPHGAIDHLVTLGLANKTLNVVNSIVVCALYLLAVALMLITWWVSPFVGLSLFLVITVYHWGKADLAFESMTTQKQDSMAQPLHRGLHLLFRGFLPIGIPFFAHHELTQFFINTCISNQMSDFEITSGPKIILLLIFSLLIFGEILFLAAVVDRRIKILIEDAGLVLFFILTPPILAIGIYFCFWHGLRHVLRLCYYDEIGDVFPPLLCSIRTFYVRAFPFTLASIGILLSLVLSLPNSTDVDKFLGLYLIVISSLTLPHLLVVEWMDATELPRL